MATDASELYGLALDRFVPDRAALVKKLRGEGKREEAQRVTGLRKPSVPAWAINQLVREQPTGLADLFAAGDGLKRAQAELLAGTVSAGELRSALARERETIEQLTSLAAGLLSRGGSPPSASVLERVSETLHAAALDPDARDAVRSGCLARELRHVGIGAATVSDPATIALRPEPRVRASRSPASAPAPTNAPAPSARDRTRRTAAERERVQREYRDRVARARRAEEHARRQAETAARAVEAAADRRDHAAEALREAETDLLRTATQAEQARATHKAAQQALTQAEHADPSAG